jgi:hypothetical protein
MMRQHRHSEAEDEAVRRVMMSATEAEAAEVIRARVRRARKEIGELRALAIYHRERFGESPTVTAMFAMCDEMEANMLGAAGGDGR